MKTTLMSDFDVAKRLTYLLDGQQRFKGSSAHPRYYKEDKGKARRWLPAEKLASSLRRKVLKR